jgi:hypothetical protein
VIRRFGKTEKNWWCMMLKRQILQTQYWDSATLRRELVGYKMQARDKGIYWRLPEGELLPINMSNGRRIR